MVEATVELLENVARQESVAGLQHEGEVLAGTVVVHCVPYALEGSLLAAAFHESIVAGRDVVEAQVAGHEVLLLRTACAVDDCEVVGVVLPEDGVERVLEREDFGVDEARQNHAHRQLVLQSSVVGHPLRRRQRLRVLGTVVQAKTEAMQPQLTFQRLVRNQQLQQPLLKTVFPYFLSLIIQWSKKLLSFGIIFQL